MTTYTAIPNGDIDQDSPVKQTLMTLLRDNPIAMMEGASGAPKLRYDALDHTDTATTNAGTFIRQAYAKISEGTIGSVALARNTSANSKALGDTISGSSLLAAAADGFASVSLSGSWLCLGRAQGNTAADERATTLWLRYA